MTLIPLLLRLFCFGTATLLFFVGIITNNELLIIFAWDLIVIGCISFLIDLQK